MIKTQSNLEVIREVDENSGDENDNRGNISCEEKSGVVPNSNSLVNLSVVQETKEMNEVNDNEHFPVNGNSCYKSLGNYNEQQELKINNQLPTFGMESNYVSDPIISSEHPSTNHDNAESLETQNPNKNYIEALLSFFDLCSGCC